MDLGTLLVVILVFALIAFLIKKAPFVDDPYKPIALWVLLAFFVLWLISSVLGGFPNIRIGR